MKKTLCLIPTLFCLMGSLFAAIITNPSSATANVGFNMGFRQDCAEPSPVQATWNWGDGQALSGVAADTSWNYHVYRNPGTYTVHVQRYNFVVTPYCSPAYTDEYKTVTILENRFVSASPATPTPGQTVTFTAGNFNTPGNITWVMGDGTTLSHVGSSVTHAYAAAGNYSIRAYDWNGSTTTTPVTLTLTVASDNRQIFADPAKPLAGQTVMFTASHFNTPANITWVMGDGTTLSHVGSSVSHAYATAGSYTVRAFDWNGDTKTLPVSLSITVSEPARAITFSPNLPRVDQGVAMQAVNFKSSSIDWNFGDGTPLATHSAAVSHRYQNPGTFTISAREHGMDQAPVTRQITILSENRSLILSASEAMKGELLTIKAANFRGKLILWDFGDRSVASGPATMTHAYALPGTYVITARDENGASAKKFTAAVSILGISDQVNLEIAEITLDNGKYYKVIPKNSKSIRALLRMKMRGTGSVAGYWLVDNQPYEFFNETVYQGQIKTIFTREVPGLPVLDPGMHTVSLQLTRPEAAAAVFPILRYFVLPYENEITMRTPTDGSIIKEDNVAIFSWQGALGGSYYQIAFADSLFPLMRNDPSLNWRECSERYHFMPDKETWNSIRRNQWSYWKVRALDSSGNIVAESGIREMKVIVPGAKIGIQKLTDLDGNTIPIHSGFTATRAETVLIHGSLTYPAEAEYLILRVYANDDMIDQLLFRDLKKDEARLFETSVPNTNLGCRVIFQVMKSSSPSVIVGYEELALKKE